MKNVTTHVFALALAASCFCSLVVAGEKIAKSDPDPVQPILDRLAKMDFAEQQAWLRRLEDRSARAARLSLNPEQSDRQQALVRSLLHRKMITWQVLREAIHQTDSLERKAVDRLAERYRNKVLEAFREWPAEAGRRAKAWETTLREWKNAGKNFEQQDRLIDWLESSIGPIPERPIVDGQQPPAETAPQGPSEAVKPRPPKPTPKPIPKPAPKLPEKPVEEPSKPEPPRPVEQPLPPAEAVAPEKPAQPRRPERVPFALPTETQVPPPSPVKPVAPAEPTGKLPAGSVRVNADELAVRIAGCNMAFRALESELDEKGTWDAARLEPLVNRLKILVVRRGDLDLFRELLPADKRSTVAKLEKSKSAVSQLGARIFEARRTASSEEFKGTEASRRVELGRLEMLSRRLAETAAKGKKAQSP
ncbi:MAG: hypothetical protein KKE86_11445 [Planctomycetes bacterium]|nr:hypothetical protein [Planctomycetota bacterium]MBU4399935.1 hypothetical protein [Planctomycetota bacterium]MCG2684356.1 hypothetical protein [Planctomycetales bacterium]